MGLSKLQAVTAHSHRERDRRDNSLERVVETAQAQQELLTEAITEEVLPSESAEPTAIPTTSAENTGTPTPSIEPTATPSAAVSATLTPSVTLSVTATPTVTTGTGGNIPTATPSLNPTSTPSASLTVTPRRLPTPLPTVTPQPTATPTALPTPTTEPVVLGTAAEQDPPEDEPKSIGTFLQELSEIDIPIPKLPQSVELPGLPQRNERAYAQYQQQPWLTPTEEKIGLLAGLGSLIGGGAAIRDKILRFILKGVA